MPGYQEALRRFSNWKGFSHGMAEFQNEIQSCQTAIPFVFEGIDALKIDGLIGHSIEQWNNYDLCLPFNNTLFDFRPMFDGSLIDNGKLFHLQTHNTKDIFDIKNIPHGVILDDTCIKLVGFDYLPNKIAGFPGRIVWLFRCKDHKTIKTASSIAEWVPDNMHSNIGQPDDYDIFLPITLLALIDATGVAIEKQEYSGTINKNRIKMGKAPFPDYHIVKLRPPQPKTNLGGTHASPCQHRRRAHWRTFRDGRKIRIEETIINYDPNNPLPPTNGHYEYDKNSER